MRAQWIARLLLPRLRSLAARRPPDFEISRSAVYPASPESIYLRRWHVVPYNRWLNVYLHNMLRDDDTVPHDHPYFSVGLMLDGELRENYVMRPDREAPYVRGQDGAYHLVYSTRLLRAGDVVWRSWHFAHQLCVPPGGAWTLFVTGPRVRDWGFWCPRGWIRRADYEERTPGPEGTGVSRKGRGCGE